MTNLCLLLFKLYEILTLLDSTLFYINSAFCNMVTWKLWKYNYSNDTNEID